MANPFPKLVKYFTLENNRRWQVSALPDTHRQFALFQFAVDLGGEPYGDWFQLPTERAVDQVIAKTQNDLGGVVYDLPVNSGTPGPTFNPILAPFFSAGGSRLEMSALIDIARKITLVRFMHELGGTDFDDWVELPDSSAVDQIIKKTVTDLGGVVYDLRVRH